MIPPEVELIAAVTVTCLREPLHWGSEFRRLKEIHGWGTTNYKWQACMWEHGLTFPPMRAELRWKRSLFVMAVLDISIESFHEALTKKDIEFQQRHPGAKPLDIPSMQWMYANQTIYAREEVEEATSLERDEDLGFIDEELDYKGQTTRLTPVNFTASLRGVKTTFYVRDEYELEGVKVLRVECAINNLSLGTVQARLLRRDRFLDSFWDTMDACSQDCGDLASTIFTKNGHLKPKWVSSQYKGTGVWDVEDFLYPFLVIENIQVNPNHRRAGIGRYMVQVILQEAEKRGACFSCTWPTELGDSPESSSSLLHYQRPEGEKGAIYNGNVARAIGFWRAMGFRRIGTSHWFCLHEFEDHPSRRLAPEDDFGP
ncbi:hypothetical protein HYALB_00003398 [Hymenoscyphus albidus]|uniref:N-acetyltransferase domain-containing protein n=1 Tax=Hymenoscyphus albidus TaxID=595503 RepID=A0A9N9LE30_9HELO|nr:hypothetical protein HYALB_00003398 [Hymenoscyphus albidus]